MDNQIYKYRFGQTLQLEPSIYTIGFVEPDTGIKQTVCKWKMKFAKDNQPGWIVFNKNRYYFNNLDQYNSFVTFFPAYDDVTSNQCFEL